MTFITVSPLRHTWLIDVDGTVFSHNGHLTGEDVLLPGVREFWAQIPPEDVVILLTARLEDHRAPTLAALAAANLRYDHVVFGLPTGERILINDGKPSGLVTALAVPVVRDLGLAEMTIQIDPAL